ncbi:MAG: hypothetical protein ACRBCS_12725 [Cellvibrionaceae bacterium]
MNSHKKLHLRVLCILFMFYGINGFAEDILKDKKKDTHEAAILDFALTGDDSFDKDKQGLTSKQPASPSTAVKPHAVDRNKGLNKQKIVTKKEK